MKPWNLKLTIWKPAEEFSTREIQREVNSAGRTFLISRIEPRAFSPSSCRFGLEDRCRERGPSGSRNAECGFKKFAFNPQSVFRNRQSNGPGREADHASSNSTIPGSHRSAGMSHAPITCELNLVPKEGLKPSTSGLPFFNKTALRQFVYSGGK